MNNFTQVKKSKLNSSLFKVFVLTLICFFSFSSCSKTKMDPNRPLHGKEKRIKNIAEGRGASIGNIIKKNRGTNYEFSTSNPMWRASLETLDFLPLTTVDYSGGIIITDWYSDANSNGKESIKISLRFLGNDIRSESLKVIIHKKICSTNQNCKVTLLSKTKIKEELHTTILRKAALLEKESKKKKKK